MIHIEHIEHIEIYCWPDSTWCYEEELEEYLLFKSDDFKVIRIPEETVHSTESIELEV